MHIVPAGYIRQVAGVDPQAELFRPGIPFHIVVVPLQIEFVRPIFMEFVIQHVGFFQFDRTGQRNFQFLVVAVFGIAA
ncbi:hypothetical protein D1872_333920 [compost metagenome]